MSRRIFTFITLTALALALLISAGCEQTPGGATAGPGAAEQTPQADRAEPSAAPVMYTEPEDTPPPEPSVSPPEPELTPQPGEKPELEPAWEPTPEPTPDPTPEPAAEPTPEPTPGPAPETVKSPYTGPDLVECEPVEDDFFADAAFFGNSLVDGLRYFGGIEPGSFYAATSASVVNVEVTLNSELESGEECTLLEAMTEKSHGKIYILLGINEISFEPEYFSWLYGGLLDRIRELEPGADIYIMSLSPVTEKCSEESEFFNMERIAAYNSALYALAREKECYYVDLCQALAGEDGYLPEEVSTADGIHLIREEYPHWAEYLRTHIPACP